MKLDMVTIKSISKQIRGVSYTPKDVSDVQLDKYIRLLRANNITENGIDLTDTVFVNSKCVSEIQKLKVGDILIAASSGSIKIVGKAILIEEEINSAFGAFCKVIRPNEKVDYRYLSYYFRSSDYRQKISHLAAGANINNLRNEDLDNLEIPLPPLATQKRIAEILDAADALKRKDQELLKKYDELAQAIFIDMFGDPVKNEKGWEVKKLDEVCMKITDGEHINPTIVNEGKPLIMAKDIQFEGVDFSDYKCVTEDDFLKFTKKCKPELGDLILVSRGATIGRCCVVNTEKDFCLMGSTILIKPSSTLTSGYLFELFKNENFKRILVNVSSASAQQAIYIANVKELNVPMPPIELQNEFKRKIKINLVQVKIHNQVFEQTNKLFDSLIQKAFKGELVL